MPQRKIEKFADVLEVAVAIVRRDGRLLVTLRRPDQPMPSLWEFPGGKINPGETPTAAAVREVLEETGLSVTAIGTLPPVEHTYPDRTVRLHPILFEAAVGEPHPIEVAACRWVTPEELPTLPMPAGSASIVQALCDGMGTPGFEPGTWRL